MCMFKERKEVGRRRKKPGVLNSTHHRHHQHHHVVLIRMTFPSPEYQNEPV